MRWQHSLTGNGTGNCVCSSKQCDVCIHKHLLRRQLEGKKKISGTLGLAEAESIWVRGLRFPGVLTLPSVHMPPRNLSKLGFLPSGGRHSDSVGLRYDPGIFLCKNMWWSWWIPRRRSGLTFPICWWEHQGPHRWWISQKSQGRLAAGLGCGSNVCPVFILV